MKNKYNTKNGITVIALILIIIFIVIVIVISIYIIINKNEIFRSLNFYNVEEKNLILETNNLVDTETGETIITRYKGTSKVATSSEIRVGYYAYDDNGVAIEGSVPNYPIYAGTSTPATANKILKGFYVYDKDGKIIEGTASAFESYAGTSILITADKINKGYYAYNNSGKVIEGTNEKIYKYVSGSYTIASTVYNTYYSQDGSALSDIYINTGLSNIVAYGASFSGYIRMGYTSWSPDPIVYQPIVSNLQPYCFCVSSTSYTHLLQMIISKPDASTINVYFVGWRDGTSYVKQTYNMSFTVSDGTVQWWALGY
jgi:hypothetical protein